METQIKINQKELFLLGAGTITDLWGDTFFNLTDSYQKSFNNDSANIHEYFRKVLKQNGTKQTHEKGFKSSKPGK